MPMRHNESVREFSARVKQIGDEAQTVIIAKFKEQTTEDLTVGGLFELMMCDSVIRQMQAHPKLRHDYNTIVNDIDDCVTLETLGHKASKISDRQVTVDLTADPRTFLTQKQVTPDPMVEVCKQINVLQKQYSLMAKHFDPKVKQVDGAKSDSKPDKRKTIKEKMSDPEWCLKVADYECHKFRDNKKCERPICPFKPCNKRTTGNSLYSTIGDFQ